MAERTFMTEGEIQAVENLNPDALATHFGTVVRIAKQFARALRSYRIASNVAIAAWKYVKFVNEEKEAECVLAYHELEVRLAKFSPENFTAPPIFLEHEQDALEELYNALATHPLADTRIGAALVSHAFEYIQARQRRHHG